MSRSEQATDNGRLLVALATYNEIGNLPHLIAVIRDALPAADILVVDDNSPDGTGRWCDEQRALGRPIVCLHRPKKLGLGSATAAAFGWAIQRGYTWLGTLDADFAHDPREFPAMIRVLAADPLLDVVIGSRYVPGGRIDGWPWRRRIASKFINIAARFWLGLSTHDNSGAFRLYRVAVLRGIAADRLTSNSYAYLEEVLLRLQRAGARVAEVPITFRQRQQGRSKLGMSEILGTIRDLVFLRFRSR